MVEFSVVVGLTVVSFLAGRTWQWVADARKVMTFRRRSLL
ncbi:hypothetical protein GCM10027569_21020 [Flindersiella endophytica]